MGVIVAVGGGEMGRTKVFSDGSIKKYPIETLDIDRKIVELSNKKNPKLLFLGTASGDPQSFFDVVETYFGERFGCVVSNLSLTKNKYSYEFISDKILSSDIIYVGGGDTKKMLAIWRDNKVDVLLKKAYEKGIVLSGISAGAVCWFEKYDNTDYIDKENDEIGFFNGLGFVEGYAIPHFDKFSKNVKKKLKLLLEKNNIMGWGIEDCTALVIKDKIFKKISSKKGKNVIPFSDV